MVRHTVAPEPGAVHARLPSGLGQEMAGIVTAVGEGVDDLAVGDKVASFPAESPNDYPVYGELIVLPRTSLTRYPDVLSPIEASVHYTPLLIAYFAYVDLARVKPGNLRWLPTPVTVPAHRLYNWAKPWAFG